MYLPQSYNIEFTIQTAVVTQTTT